MTWSVSNPMRVGPVTVAVIARAQVNLHGDGQRIVGVGSKRPELLLLARDGQIIAQGLDGATHDPGEVEARYPGALAQFRATLASP